MECNAQGRRIMQAPLCIQTPCNRLDMNHDRVAWLLSVQMLCAQAITTNEV